MLALLLLVPVSCVSWWNQSPDFIWAMFRDSREYPHTDDPMHITKGDGDLEEDLLPHFQVRMACDVTGLRYGEWEDYGSMGWLALRFETSPSCLDDFLRDNDLHRVPENLIPAHQVPDAYEWRFDLMDAYYSAEPSDDVRLSVAVDNRSSRPAVYIWSAHR